MGAKPIRVFYSELSGRFYASAHYREETMNGKPIVVITGKKFDVTNDIAAAVIEHDLEFTPTPPDSPWDGVEPGMGAPVPTPAEKED